MAGHLVTCRIEKVPVNTRGALSFVRKYGVVLMSARGPIPNLAEAIVGEPIRGSWWAHPQSHHMYQVFDAVCESSQVLVCRLVGGKVTLVHRRLWPALVRLASALPKPGLGAVRQEHTSQGSHRAVVTPFPRWVPRQVSAQAKQLSEAEAVSRFGAELFLEVSADSSRNLTTRCRGRPRVSRRLPKKRKRRATRRAAERKR